MSLITAVTQQSAVSTNMMDEFDIIATGAQVGELRKSFKELNTKMQRDIILELKKHQYDNNFLDNLKLVEGILILFNNEFTPLTPQGAYDAFFSTMTDNLGF